MMYVASLPRNSQGASCSRYSTGPRYWTSPHGRDTPSGYLIRSDIHAPCYLPISLLTCRWISPDPKLLSDRVSHFKVQISDRESLLIDNVFMLLH